MSEVDYCPNCEKQVWVRWDDDGRVCTECGELL